MDLPRAFLLLFFIRVYFAGAQWGDEGKGKVVDMLATEADVVCRCQVRFYNVYLFIFFFFFSFTLQMCIKLSWLLLHMHSIVDAQLSSLVLFSARRIERQKRKKTVDPLNTNCIEYDEQIE